MDYLQGRLQLLSCCLLLFLLLVLATTQNQVIPLPLPPPPTSTADCVFAEDVGGTIGCGLIALPQVFNSTTTYNITVVEVGEEGATDKLRSRNFIFTQIINGSISDSEIIFPDNNQIELSEYATHINLSIVADNNVFGEFYIELVKSDDASVKVRYTISITSVNDLPEFEAGNSPEVDFAPANSTSPASYRFTDIPFNSNASYLVGNVSATDVEDAVVTYGIIGGTDDTDLFKIDPTTGEITLKAQASTPDVYTFNVAATDDNGGITMAVITVSVTTSTTTAPRADCMFAEDVGGTVDCGLLTLTRFDSETIYNVTVGEVGEETTNKIGLSNFTFIEIINGNPSGEVEPDANNQLTLLSNATALNITISGIAENVFGEFYIDLVKSDDPTIKVRYTISITPVPDAPEFVAGIGSGVFTSADGATPANYNFTNIPLNSRAGYSMGNVSATDPDGGDPMYTISVDAVDDGLFEINEATGEITLSVTANVAIEYTFNVTANDGNGGSATATISVRVLPNEAPKFIAITGLSSQFTPAAGATPANYNFADLHIASPVGSSVGNVSATDANNDAISYNISAKSIRTGDNAVDNELFKINSTTGEITLLGVVGFAGEYHVNATATDDQGESTEATIFVNIYDITPPAFTRTSYNFDLSLSMAIDGAVVGNVSAMDAEETDFGYSLEGGGDLFEFADADNPDRTRNIILGRAATLSDFAEPSVTFQVMATHTIGGISSNVPITVNLNNDLPFDDDFDGDGVQGFYDAFPHDATMNVMGDGEPGNPFIISNIYQLQAVAGVDHAGTALDSSDFTGDSFLYGDDADEQLTKHYVLANDINASDTADATVWNKSAVDADNFVGQGWTPIAGNSSQSFSGSFNGDGYQIRDLYMRNRMVNNSQHFALFGINSGNITSVGLINIETEIQALNNHYLRNYDNNEELTSNSIHGYQGAVASLAAFNQESAIISYSYVTGLVNGSGEVVGGLVGANGGELSYSYSTAAVRGEGATGGLVGTNFASSKQLNTYATGDVHAGAGVGNPILLPQDDTSQGVMNTQGNVGGLIGSIASASSIVRTAYALGLATHSPAFDLRVGNIAGDRYTDSTFASLYWKDGVAPGVAVYSKYTLNSQGNGNPGAVGDQTGTNSTTTAQLQGCGLGGMVITGVTPDPTCTDLFPASDWGNTTDSTAGTFDIERGWIFNADEYPSLSAVRSSDDKQLFPSAADQECHRDPSSPGCE